MNKEQMKEYHEEVKEDEPIDLVKKRWKNVIGLDPEAETDE